MIEVDGVSVCRGRHTVLEQVSFTVPAGQCGVVIGPNGSGKSTLVGAIAGDLQPVSGTVRLNRTPVIGTKPSDLARIRAVMTQQTRITLGFTVAEVVAMARWPWPDSGDDEAIVAGAMAEADISHLAQRPVQALSGGELARVSLARALAQQTEILIFDEPTAALDLRHQVQVLRCVKQRTRAGSTSLVVLHDITLAAAFADMVIVLDDGRVVASGPPAEVLVPEVLAAVYQIPVVSMSHPLTGLPVLVPAMS